MTRCDLTDLLLTECAHCRKVPDPPAETGEMGPWFTARHGGVCGGCKEPIGAGQQIRATGTGYGYLAECCGTN